MCLNLRGNVKKRTLIFEEYKMSTTVIVYKTVALIWDSKNEKYSRRQ